MDLKEMHGQVMEAMVEIDVQLDSLGGGKAAGKRKVGVDLAAKHESEFSTNLESLTTWLDTQDVETQTAVFTGLVNGLKDKYGKTSDAFLDGLVEAQPKQEALITEEEGHELMKKRSALYQQAKSIVELGASMEGLELKPPTAKRGGFGPRAPRNISKFTWSVNGVEQVDEDDNPLSHAEVAKAHGYAKGSELTAAFKENKIDQATMTVVEDFKLPDGSILSGFRPEEEGEGEDAD